jgi:hypothetical protein
VKFVKSHYEKIVFSLVILSLVIVSCISYFNSASEGNTTQYFNAGSFSIDSFGDEKVLVFLKKTHLVPNDSVQVFNSKGEKIDTFKIKKVIFSKKSKVSIQLKTQIILKGRLLNPSSTILTTGWEKSRSPIAIDTDKGVKNISFKEIEFIRGEQKLVLDKSVDDLDPSECRISVYQSKSQILIDSNRTEKNRWTNTESEENSSIYDLFTPPIIYLVDGELATSLPEAPKEIEKEEEFGLTILSFEKKEYRFKLVSWIGQTPYFEDLQKKVSETLNKNVKNRIEVKIPYKENNNYRPGLPSLVKTTQEDAGKLLMVEFFTVQQVTDSKTGGSKPVGRALVRDFKKGGKPFEINSLMKTVNSGDFKILLKFDIEDEAVSEIEIDGSAIEKEFNFGKRSYKILNIDNENKNIEVEKKISGESGASITTLSL